MDGGNNGAMVVAVVEKALKAKKLLVEVVVTLEEVEGCADGGAPLFTVKFRQFGLIGTLKKTEVINRPFFERKYLKGSS